MKRTIKLIIYLSLLLVSACKDSNLVDGEPPCINCPIDFRLTDFEPAWSPDGRTIAYIHGDTVFGKTGIYLIDTSGKNNHIIYSSPSAYSPDWSPDGQWLVFSDQAEIFKMKINGDSVTQLTPEGRNFFPSWNPDGKMIVLSRSYAYPEIPDVQGIWIMNSLNGNNKRKVCGGVYPSWSSDGNYILFVGYHNEIYRVNVYDTSMVDRLTSLNQSNIYATTNSYPKYSPDGTMIAFTSQPSGLASQTQIWVMNSGGTNLRQLTTTEGYSCDWSPTGEWLVYTDSRAMNGRLWLIRIDGSENHQLSF